MTNNRPSDADWHGQQSYKQEKLSKKLSSLQLSSQEKETAEIAKQNKMDYVNLHGFPVDSEVLVLIPEEEAREKKYAVIARTGKKLTAVITDLKCDLKEIGARLSDDFGYEISQKFLVSKPGFELLLSRYKSVPKSNISSDIGLTKEALEKAQKNVQNLAALKGRIRDVATTELLETLIAGSIMTKSSDIHIEPEKESVAVRYRIDGILQNISTIPLDAYKRVLTRVKLIGGMKLNVTNIPQDGRVTIDMGGDKNIDLRLSILPTAYGETLVIRLLGLGEVALKIPDLGLRGDAAKIINEEIAKPNGMILTTGPTGSGKTTSLYAFLNQVKNPEINIITLENPIEYRLSGVSQTQIDTDAGMTFASGLRAILRQDPDVIMVGEIRDLETAEISCQAALTGHIVFSTLHTNDAAGVIPRLINMGIRTFVLGPALNAMIAQRLVRRLCQECHEEYKPDEISVDKLKQELGGHFPKGGIKKLFRAKKDGCEKCHHTGYSGRIGIYEVIRNDAYIRRLIDERASGDEIVEAAVRKQNTVLMRQDGLLKSVEGITSLEEVNRVT